MRHWYHMLFISCLAFALPSYATETAMGILEKMTDASKNLTYEGIFTYHSGDKLQSIKIYHRSNEQSQLERMIALNGAEREVIVTNDMVTCIQPKGKQVNVSRKPLRQGFPTDLPKRLQSAASYYKVELGGETRVADRQAYELVITPLDDYRYGYRLWVDVDTYVLLKSELVGVSGEVLETFSFSSFDTDKSIPDEKFTSELTGDEVVWRRHQHKDSTVKQKSNASTWHVAWLPAGFELLAMNSRMRANNGADVEQQVYSDGLSSISIFIEKIRAQHNHLHGGSHMGAINAFGTIMNAHFVTVVGEVPAQTVEKVGNAIAFTDEKNHD